MAKKRQGTLFAAGLILALNATAQSFDVDARALQACRQVEQVRPPAPVPALPPSCASFNYYDKLHQAVTSAAEWDGVRACALAAQDQAVLSMLYANGLGVARDLAIATHYACSATQQLPGWQYRVSLLQELKSGGRTGPYDQCDDRNSGVMQAVCAGIDDRQADKVRTAFFARLRRHLPASQQTALDELVAAGRAYADARSGETDHHGSAAVAMATEADAREKEWLREHLAAFEKGDFNLSPPAELPEDETELNLLLAAIMAIPSLDAAEPDRVSDSTVKKADVRATEDLWLVYRDAWVRFAALRYPAVSSDAVKVELTIWRTHLLRALAPPAS